MCLSLLRSFFITSPYRLEVSPLFSVIISGDEVKTGKSASNLGCITFQFSLFLCRLYFWVLFLMLKLIIFLTIHLFVKYIWRKISQAFFAKQTLSTVKMRSCLLVPAINIYVNSLGQNLFFFFLKKRDLVKFE